jgi:hypothetical protein
MFFLGKYWKSVRMVAVPRGCALPGAQLQEETETVSALASLTVDVEQPFAQDDSRYESSVGNHGGQEYPDSSLAFMNLPTGFSPPVSSTC